MAFNAQGVWVPEDDSVQSRLPGLLAKDNPLMTQARTGAAQYANKRGLLNSSIAAGAGEDAALRVALPIASQEAGQAAQKNLASITTGSSEKIAGLNVAAHDRQYLASYTAELQKKYGAMFSEIIKNNDLPAAARNKYYEHVSALRDTDLNLAEQIYGVNLDWTSSVATQV